MISTGAFRDQPTLHGPRVRLEPMESHHFDGLRPMLTEPEVARLTCSQREITEEQARQWTATRQEHHDRADWTIVRAEDDLILGEVVLNDLDEHNASVNFRILLVDPQLFGHGYGSEATRLVVDYALDVVGLHRISLDVFDFNPRARRAYEKCGFVVEGLHRDVLLWDGRWHDSVHMAILSTDPRPAATTSA